MANEKLMKFHQRMDQLALMTDSLKVQEILNSEYGIQLSDRYISTSQTWSPMRFGRW